jgi:hypothetical protein
LRGTFSFWEGWGLVEEVGRERTRVGLEAWGACLGVFKVKLNNEDEVETAASPKKAAVSIGLPEKYFR